MNQALKIYDGHEIYLPERVRVLFNLIKVLRALGRIGDSIALEGECTEFYQQLVPTDLRPLSELSDRDFDNQIVFWSR